MNSFDLALNYLTYKSRTEKEVRDYLIKKKISKKYIEETIKKLKEYNYLNDSLYVKQSYEINKIGKRYGFKRLSYSLKKKGINDEELALLKDLLTEEEELDNCLYHFQKLLKITDKVPYKKRIQRISNSLNTKGFTYHDYSRFLNEIPKDSPIDEEIFNKNLEKTINKFKRKGYKDYELKNRVISSLMGKGYSYSLIKEKLDDYFL